MKREGRKNMVKEGERETRKGGKEELEDENIEGEGVEREGEEKQDKGRMENYGEGCCKGKRKRREGGSER